MNEALFAKVVENHLQLDHAEYKFISIKSEPATKAGDNYMAVLMRSKIVIQSKYGDEKTLRYIAKALIANEFNEALGEGLKAFPKEQKMYSEIIPAFEKLYADIGINADFGPKCYHTTNDPTPIIVMEDLSDYVMVEKSLGFDQDHVELSLSKLAMFHAASMVYYDINGSYGDLFTDGVFTRRIESTYAPYLDNFMDFYIAALKKLPNGEKYAEKAEKWRGVLFAAMCKTLEFDDSAFNVLNHGDTWSNNLMFQYDSNQKVCKMKFVDYQISYWGTVAHDFYYLMMTSCCQHNDYKMRKFDEFVMFYFDNLIENLKVLKYRKKLPTIDDLRKELSRRKFFGERSSESFHLKFQLKFDYFSCCCDCRTVAISNV